MSLRDNQKTNKVTLGPLPPFRGQNYQSDSPISSLLTNKGYPLSGFLARSYGLAQIDPRRPRFLA